MATLSVPSDFTTIRDAINAAATGDTILIAAGTYDITYPGYNNSLTYSAAPNCSTGFTSVTSLIYDGAGKFGGTLVTTITGNARLFQQNVDGQAPISVTYRDLDFLYGSASGYILSTNATASINLDNLSFRGSHSGNTGANGNYSDVRNVPNFTLNNSSVTLTGQSGFNASAGTGGSSFLLLNGGSGGNITITNNSFNETGYRNAISIFDSTNVTIQNNTFFRSGPTTRRVRSGGEKLKDSSGSVSNNNFFDGSYLAIEKTTTGTVDVLNNTFAQFNPSGPTIPNPILTGGAVGIVLQGANASTALGMVKNNTFAYVAPFSNTTNSAITINTTNAPSNVYIDPITNTSKYFQSYFVGGTAIDTLTGTTDPEYFIGGAGSDTINTGGGADYILFNTTLDAANNVDTITNFNSNSRIILDRKIFRNIEASYDGSVSSTIGAVNDTSQVSNTGAAIDSLTRIIFNPVTKDLFYDSDGTGPDPAVKFASLPGYTGSMTGFNSTNLTAVNIGII